jgi:hypothetical protein
VAYIWIGNAHNGHSLLASIKTEDGSAIQELARVMDVEDEEEWEELNGKFMKGVLL